VYACAFSLDGSALVSASGDQTLKLWDATRGVECTTLVGHQQKVWACAFSGDGTRVFSASDDNTIKIWETGTGQVLATIAGHRQVITACAFSPNGNRIVSGERNGALHLWDGQTGAKLAALADSGARVTACAFSPDGTRFFSQSFDALVLWAARDGRELARLAFPAKSGSAFVSAFSSDGSRIILVGDMKLRVWGPQDGRELKIFNPGLVRISAFALSPDGYLLAVMPRTAEMMLLLCDTMSGEELARYPLDGEGTCVAWDRSRLLAAGTAGGTLHLLRLER